MTEDIHRYPNTLRGGTRLEVIRLRPELFQGQRMKPEPSYLKAYVCLIQLALRLPRFYCLDSVSPSLSLES